MDRVKRFIDIGLPIDACNFNCHYCYISHQNHTLNARPKDISRTPDEVRKALSTDRLGGVCLINMCAYGETLLSNGLLPIVFELIQEGHYLMLVTNGTPAKRFQEMSEWPKEIKNHLFIKFSFHYLELKRKKLLQVFAENVKKMKIAGVSFTVEAVPTDELVPYIDEMKRFCIEHFGALCHISIARDEKTPGFKKLTLYNIDDYQKIWGQFSSSFFEFKNSTFDVKRTEFCYAGDWSFSLDLQTGYYRKCTYEGILGNIYENIEFPLVFSAVGKRCKMAHCYNSHAYLALGVIPELQTPTVAEIRNRVCSDGTEWLTPPMKAFMSTKLYESNDEYNWLEKITLKRPLKTFLREEFARNTMFKQLRKIEGRFRGKEANK